MIVELRYGRRGLPVRFGPECDVTVVRKPPMPVLDDAGAAVQRAFADPVNAPPPSGNSQPDAGRPASWSATSRDPCRTGSCCGR